MPKQIVIGREGNQPFALNDPKVSGRHAVLIVHENGALQLADTNSTNGTFIYNGQTFARIMPGKAYNVSPDSMIRLGPETQFHVRRLIPGFIIEKPVKDPLPPVKPKRYDISRLRLLYDDYHEKKINLDSKSDSINGMRSMIMLISMATGGCSGVLADLFGLSNNKLMSTLLGVGIGLTLVIVLNYVIKSRQEKVRRDRQANEHDFAVNYCCPGCRLPFKGKVYENILAEGKCPKCKAEYYESHR